MQVRILPDSLTIFKIECIIFSLGRDILRWPLKNRSYYQGSLHSSKCSPKKEARNHGGRFSKSIFQINGRGDPLNTFEPGDSSAVQEKYGKTEALSLPNPFNQSVPKPLAIDFYEACKEED